MIVYISDRATADIAGQVGWLKQHSPLAGRDAALRILHVIDLLADFPDMGVSIGGDRREKAVGFGRDGFVIQYRRGRSSITVLRVLHSRQNRA